MKRIGVPSSAPRGSFVTEEQVALVTRLADLRLALQLRACSADFQRPAGKAFGACSSSAGPALLR